MKISGFSFVRNATKMYLPVWESISSVLPMVDEFVLALGKGDADDHTLDEIEKLNFVRNFSLLDAGTRRLWGSIAPTDQGRGPKSRDEENRRLRNNVEPRHSALQ